MKRLFAMLLALVMVLSLAACANNDTTTTGKNEDTTAGKSDDTTAGKNEPSDVKVMSYAEYMAAELETEVVIEAYVQAHQDWWDGKVTVYAQDADGAYFIYEMACSEEDAAKLVKGAKIRVTGVKKEWSGEIEIMEPTFEFVESEKWIAEAKDVTDLWGKEDLIKHQNQLVSFKGMTIEAITYKNDEPGDDIYVTVSLDGVSHDFCVERYLTGPDTDVYKAFADLKKGDKVDIEGFLYWYESVNTHITSVKKAA